MTDANKNLKKSKKVKDGFKKSLIKKLIKSDDRMSNVVCIALLFCLSKYNLK